MYNGKFENQRGSAHTGTHARGADRTARKGGRGAAAALAVLLLAALSIGGTVAWLTSRTGAITNTFSPAHVSCEVTENFDGSVKTQVNVRNTSDIPAFVRVKLVTYRTNDQGQHIGGVSELPAFTPGTGWVEYGGYYYYIRPVAPGASPAADLADRITLTASYADADGGHQSMDVMAEAIQSVPEAAVRSAWGEGFAIDANGDLVVPQN